MLAGSKKLSFYYFI